VTLDNHCFPAYSLRIAGAKRGDENRRIKHNTNGIMIPWAAPHTDLWGETFS
jgi:hypothetical protein